MLGKQGIHKHGATHKTLSQDSNPTRIVCLKGQTKIQANAPLADSFFIDSKNIGRQRLHKNGLTAIVSSKQTTNNSLSLFFELIKGKQGLHKRGATRTMLSEDSNTLLKCVCLRGQTKNKANIPLLISFFKRIKSASNDYIGKILWIIPCQSGVVAVL